MAIEKRSIDERILKLQEHQKQLKEQEKKLKSKQSQTERKERTKRLIKIGAVVESVLGKPIPKEDLSKLKYFLENQEKRGQYFSKAMDILPSEQKQSIEQKSQSPDTVKISND